MVGHCIFYQYIVAILVVVVLIIIGDVFLINYTNYL